ncbi:hypothetical protein LCGC14_1638060 [marine sediment metagenome]|uniref:Uncharacterized protein n=1 Tax=marine sediment metagenome TaxID=412755 RepID=A0A0F9KGB6_9ZZZZ
MRTLNIRAGSTLLSTINTNFPEDKQPCWYADMEQVNKREDYKWKVGCKYDGKNDEYSFKISKAGDVNNERFWQRATGVDFATELIDLFKNGGSKAIENWVKQGCP